MATQCYETGRLDDALRYTEAGLAHIRNTYLYRLPYEAAAFLGGVYDSQGHPERWVELCREALAYPGLSPHTSAMLHGQRAQSMCGAGRPSWARMNMTNTSDACAGPSL